MDKLREWCRKMMTRENMIVLALTGILIMVIALPSGGKKKEEGGSSKSVLSDRESVMMNVDETAAARTREEELEGRLERFLSCMDGVGSVKVMITYQATEERVVEKDMPSRSSSQTSENDSAGGSRSVIQQDQQEDTVYTTDEKGNQIPYVKKTLAARVEGVTVLAQGGGSPVIQKNITDVIEALFGIEAHKIKVAKMKINEESRGSRN